MFGLFWSYVLNKAVQLKFCCHLQVSKSYSFEISQNIAGADFFTVPALPEKSFRESYHNWRLYSKCTREWTLSRSSKLLQNFFPESLMNITAWILHTMTYLFRKDRSEVKVWFSSWIHIYLECKILTSTFSKVLSSFKAANHECNETFVLQWF